MKGLKYLMHHLCKDLFKSSQGLEFRTYIKQKLADIPTSALSSSSARDALKGWRICMHAFKIIVHGRKKIMDDQEIV